MIGWAVGGGVHQKSSARKGHPSEYYLGLRQLNLRVPMESGLRPWVWATVINPIAEDEDVKLKTLGEVPNKLYTEHMSFWIILN